MCPQCKEPLIVVEFQGVELDFCLACRGTWFDAGELELVSELAGVAPGRLERALHTTAAEKRDQRRCPRCRRKMDVFHVGEPPVEVDRCRRGHGIWLDAGELAAIVKALSDSAGDVTLAGFLGDLFRHELTGQPEKG